MNFIKKELEQMKSQLNTKQEIVDKKMLKKIKIKKNDSIEIVHFIGGG